MWCLRLLDRFCTIHLSSLPQPLPSCIFLQVKRILKPGGVLLVLSYGKPPNREVHLKRQSLGFSVSNAMIDKPTAAGVTPSAGMDKMHYLYTCRA